MRTSQYYIQKSKAIAMILMMSMGIQQSWSQQYGHSKDELSASNYTSIRTSVNYMGGYDAASKLLVDEYGEVIAAEYHGLTMVGADFFPLKTNLKKFIYTDSYSYYKLKYPLIPKIDGYANDNAFGNALKQKLYYTKITKERINIENYLSPNNPISEGQRIYLMLGAVEDIIKTTMENQGLKDAEE